VARHIKEGIGAAPFGLLLPVSEKLFRPFSFVGSLAAVFLQSVNRPKPYDYQSSFVFLLDTSRGRQTASEYCFHGGRAGETNRKGHGQGHAYFTSFPGHSLASMPNSLIEITMDSSDFTTSGIPDSVFAIPEDYKEGAPRALRSAEDIRRFKSWRWWRG
jgi:hypothetical protein